MKFKKGESIECSGDFLGESIILRGVVERCIWRYSTEALLNFLVYELQILSDQVKEKKIGPFREVLRRFMSRENTYKVSLEVSFITSYTRLVEYKYNISVVKKESELDFTTTKKRDLKIQKILS